MRTTTISLLSAALLLSAGSLQAQTTNDCNEATQAGMQCQTTTDLTANVPYLAVITKNITSAILPAATKDNMDGYSSAVSGPTLNIKANFVWTLTASMGGFAQVTTQNVSYTKANVDLEVTNSVSGDGAWMTMAASRALATSEIATATKNVPTRYRVKYSWAKDLPGDYAATVTYTLTAP
jgi:hypothetical protein